ncbi:MAG TPA: phosphoglycerate mutase family protein [Chitinophagaceae bacterium]|jgi:broad specificity phosphatase PhoE|nr:phosphoglycerate mutase family protein [Chitinophagaceae bacterium]
MPRIILYILLIFFSSCRSVKYYIVRHAEKETAAAGTTMSTPNDPPLSAAGRVRAIELKEALRDKGITHIFSTNTVRTISTAHPLDELRGATKIEIYNTKDSLDQFIQKLKGIKKGNSLIVGHSNTVDDIVNKLCGETKIPKDLPETEYDNLYIVTKKGNRMKFENKTYGTPTN